MPRDGYESITVPNGLADALDEIVAETDTLDSRADAVGYLYRTVLERRGDRLSDRDVNRVREAVRAEVRDGLEELRRH